MNESISSMSAAHSLQVPAVSRTTEKLNHDILLEVMTLLDRSDVARMMRTCHTLYRHGARYVLSGSVGIYCQRHITSFCYFMLAERRIRVKYLRELGIYTDVSSRSEARRLITVIPLLTHLESLHFFFLEKLLVLDNDFVDVIASIKSLRALEFRSAEKQSIRMLKKMQAKLERLRFTYGGDALDGSYLETVPTPEREELHPTVICAQFASSLKQLATSYPTAPLLRAPDITPVYPSMVELCLDEASSWLRPYINSFPNVKRLHMNSDHVLDQYVDPSDLWDIMEIRGMNEHDQDLNGSWQHIEQFCGGVVTLFAAGFTFPIPRLVLAGLKAKRHLPLLEIVLDWARPSHLDLELCDDAWASPALGLHTILSREGSSSVTELILSFRIGPRNKKQDISSFMDGLVNSLEMLLLQYFVLKLSAMEPVEPFYPQHRPIVTEGGRLLWPGEGQEMPLVPAEQYLDDFSPATFAQRVLARVPSLKDIAVSVEGPRQRKVRGDRWKIDENGNMIVVS